MRRARQGARLTWSAPGKLFLLGEYAVLRDAPAVVTAVGRRVCVQRHGGEYSVVGGNADLRLPRAVADITGGSEVGWTVDLRAMNSDGVKIGLGSSAASAVALTAAMLAEVSPDPVYAQAYRAHHAFQGGTGSGADVAASAYGGTIVVRATPTGSTPSVERVSWPRDLHVYTVWTGSPASTRKLVESVEECADQITHLCQLAEAGAEAFADADVERFLVIASDYDNAMGSLGASAGVTIRTRAHAEIARIAREFGAAAKPSGAGGGDMSLIFARGALDRDMLARSLPDGTRLMDFALGVAGVRQEDV